MNVFLMIRYRNGEISAIPQKEISTMNSLLTTLSSFAIVHNEMLVARSEDAAIMQYRAKHEIEV